MWPKILLLGDSLTQQSFSVEGGWGAMLADSLQRRCDVLVRGFSGYNSRQWRTICRRLPRQSLQGDVATLWLGANDAAGNSPQQGVPIAEYMDNLSDIVHFLKEQCGVPKVLLLTPPPSDEAVMVPEWLEVGRSSALTAQYAAACRKVAASLQLPCVDLHSAFRAQENWRSLLSDGLHLSASGSRLVHSLVLPAVRKLVDSCMPSNMAAEDLILPPWRDASNAFPSVQIEKWLRDHPLDQIKK